MNKEVYDYFIDLTFFSDTNSMSYSSGSIEVTLNPNHNSFNLAILKIDLICLSDQYVQSFSEPVIFQILVKRKT